MSDKIIGLVVAGLILFSLFGTLYTQFIAGNTSMTKCFDSVSGYYNATCPASHRSLYTVPIILMLVGFVIMIWKSARGGR